MSPTKPVCGLTRSQTTHVIGLEGVPVEVDGKALGRLADDDRLHAGADRAAAELLGDAVRLRSPRRCPSAVPPPWLPMAGTMNGLARSALRCSTIALMIRLDVGDAAAAGGDGHALPGLDRFARAAAGQAAREPRPRRRRHAGRRISAAREKRKVSRPCSPRPIATSNHAAPCCQHRGASKHFRPLDCILPAAICASTCGSRVPRTAQPRLPTRLKSRARPCRNRLGPVWAIRAASLYSMRPKKPRPFVVSTGCAPPSINQPLHREFSHGNR